jgi:hypothetical protein
LEIDWMENSRPASPAAWIAPSTPQGAMPNQPGSTAASAGM